MIHNLESATLYCTLSHFSAVFALYGPAARHLYARWDDLDHTILHTEESYSIIGHGSHCVYSLYTARTVKYSCTLYSRINMIISKALIRLPDHEVSVQIEDTGRIVLFKQRSSTNQCDFAVFQKIGRAHV